MIKEKYGFNGNNDTSVASLFTHLKCPGCNRIYDYSSVHSVCIDHHCRSSLFAEYDLSTDLRPDILLEGRPATMWRYREFLPVLDPENIVSLGEGFTPVLQLKRLSGTAGDGQVFWKDESGNPTGSFKARGISAAVSKARELQIPGIVVPTAGNAGGALAAYCAQAGIKAHIFMPKDTPDLFKRECLLYGAALTEVSGNISDCGTAANRYAEENGWFQLSTLKEPYRLEGKKTMGYEIAEQFHWDLPDVIFYPTGGGTGLIGMWKAFSELERLGWISDKRPRMVAVQADTCDGIVQAFHLNRRYADFRDRGPTIANGLRVPKPYADRIILDILFESNGNAVSVNDHDINGAVLEIASREGLLPAPEGAALWPAYKKLRAADWVKSYEKVLLLNTGSGYKYLENLIIPA